MNSEQVSEGATSDIAGLQTEWLDSNCILVWHFSIKQLKSNVMKILQVTNENNGLCIKFFFHGCLLFCHNIINILNSILILYYM